MKSTIIITTLSLSSLAFISCGEKHSHNDHGHDPHAGHDHAAGDHSGHGQVEEDHSGHDHAPIVLGPNGGKILDGVSPQAEFFVTADRRVKITFLSEDLKAIANPGKIVSLISGDRSFPTTLAFAAEPSGHSLISNVTLPEGKSIPTIVTFKDSADAKPLYAKFTLDLSDCPSCDHLEYACTCVHH